jgi:hypothetical protein
VRVSTKYRVAKDRLKASSCLCRLGTLEKASRIKRGYLVSLIATRPNATGGELVCQSLWSFPHNSQLTNRYQHHEVRYHPPLLASAAAFAPAQNTTRTSGRHQHGPSRRARLVNAFVVLRWILCFRAGLLTSVDVFFIVFLLAQFSLRFLRPLGLYLPTVTSPLSTVCVCLIRGSSADVFSMLTVAGSVQGLESVFREHLLFSSPLCVHQ